MSGAKKKNQKKKPKKHTTSHKKLANTSTTSAKKVQTNSSAKGLLINKQIIFWLLLAVILVAVFIVRFNLLDLPLERDEGDYGLAGKLILEGATPYLDVYEQKPPGLFYSYAVVEALFGSSPRGLHMGFAFFNALTMAFIALALRSFLSDFAGIGGALAYGILSVNPFASGFAAQSEHLLVFYAALSIFLLANYFRSGQFLYLIGAGAAVAWSSTIKQNGLFFILAITIGVIAIHVFKNKLDLRKLLKEYLYFGIGGIGMALIIIILMVIQGVWSEFIFWSITFPREFYITDIGFERGMGFLKSYYKSISNFLPVLWYSSIAGFIIGFLPDKKRILVAWLTVAAILSFFSIWPGFRFYGHYWIQLFFGLALGAGLLFYSLEHFSKKFVNETVGTVVSSTALLVLLGFLLNQQKPYYFSPGADQIMNRIYGDNPFSEARAIADFIKSKNPDPDQDKLLVLGSEPQILLETGLRSPTPHTFMIFVTSPHPASKQFRTDYLQMLQKNEAKYAVFVMHPFSWLANGEEARNFVTQCYQHVLSNYKVIGVADILSKEQTIYKWDDEAGSYRTQGERFVLVLERNT